MSAQNSPHTSGPPPPRPAQASKGANPLRRTSDTFESWFRRFLMLVLVIGLPVAAVSAGLAAYESSMRAVQAQSAERQEVEARLMSTAEGATREGKQQAKVRWTDDNGTVRTGTTLVEPRTAQGATVKVWVDRDGGLTSAPMTELNATTTGWFAGGMAAIGVGAGFYAARAGMCRVLDRRRYAQWDAEWGLVEPRWSGRFRR
ncbi:Rv1733c family protein [Streptomyces massasporeus]|uniref:Membrane protein/MT1774 n=1 Tax=Streptomyces massasporeus TaxID=67324 RepID=A0ABW6LL70_9ACTN